MKRFVLVAAFTLTTTFVACGGPLDYECTVTWCTAACDTATDDQKVGEATYGYDKQKEAADAVDLCNEEQETDPDKPAEATYHSCNCESQ
jgi:hypothetical protein